MTTEARRNPGGSSQWLASVRGRGQWAFPAWLALLWWAGTTTISTALAAPQGAEFVKAFLESPPPIEEAVWETTSEPNTVFWVRWQTNALVLCAAASTNLLELPRAPKKQTEGIFGRYENYYWTLGRSPSQLALREWHGTGDPGQRTNAVDLAVQIMCERMRIGKFLNLGMDLPRGAIHWQANEFTYYAPDFKATVTGKLLPDAVGRAGTIKLTYHPDEMPGLKRGPISRRVEYAYDNDLALGGLPRTARVYASIEGNPMTLESTFTIHTFRPASSLGVKEDFSPVPFMQGSGMMSRAIVTNRALHVMREGNLVEVAKPMHIPNVRLIRTLYFLLAGLVLVGPVILYAKRRWRAKQEQYNKVKVTRHEPLNEHNCP